MGNFFTNILRFLMISFLFFLTSNPVIKSQNIQQLKNEVLQYRNDGNKTGEAGALNKLAFQFWDNKDYNAAIESFDRLSELNKEMNNKNGLMSVYLNLGLIYTEMEKHDKALKSFEESVHYSRQLKRKSSTASTLVNAATSLQQLNDPGESNKYANEALELSRELNDLNMMRTCYGLLAENYKKMGNNAKYEEYNDLYLTFLKKVQSDQLNQVKEESEVKITAAEAAKKAKEIELKHTVDTLEEFKELTEMQKMEIKLLNQEKEIQELKIKEREAQLENERLKSKRRSQIIWTFIIGFAVILVFLVLLIKQYRQIKHNNELLESQNKKIKQQNKQITDSISYAQTIQQAILPIMDNIKSRFNAFIVYKPKDIVSGDFYWYTHIEEEDLSIIAAVDCTGHGVPGAFMSMIGNTLLNGIINERKIYDPASILSELNEETISSLKQEQLENNDGMDLGLCAIKKVGTDRYNLTFCGAKRPLYYYSSSKGEISALKGDRKSIGGISRHNTGTGFNNQTLELSSKDMIYLSSDGLIDQNAPDRKRFGSKMLLNILNEIAKLPVEEQKKKLEHTLEEYKKDEEQRDDITFIGVQLL